MIPVGYADSDFGGCIDTGRSTSGYVFLAAGSPVCWSSKRQQRVSTSTTEAEYKALCHVGQTTLWLDHFLSEVNIPLKLPIAVHTDNTGVFDITHHTM
jgi:hypothetical protein